MKPKSNPYKSCETCGTVMIGILKCSGNKAPRKECIVCEKKEKDAAVA